MLARVIYGFRISVTFGLLLTLFSSLIGFRRRRAGFLRRLDRSSVSSGSRDLGAAAGALPADHPGRLFRAQFLAAARHHVVVRWTALTGVVRAEFLRARNFDYVRAARALGVSDTTLMFRHLLPNAMVATLTFLPFILNGAITTLTSLDFLGLGLPPGSPSLGELLLQGRNNLNAPWLGLTGFITWR